MPNMPLSKDHKAQTRQRIVRTAGAVFRRDGYRGAGIDTLMGEAGLTRGGFYAHFASKAELFAHVIATDHGLIRQLEGRTACLAGQWRRQTRTILRNYLLPAHLAEVSRGCSFAALTGDAGRGDEEIRSAYRRAFTQLVAELLRGPEENAAAAWRRAPAPARELAVRIAVHAVGAAIIAAALTPGTMMRVALTGALVEVLRDVDALHDAA
jgi:TetR/AcrR family transcriptional regulator, transcriptional repressor for nem operon